MQVWARCKAYELTDEEFKKYIENMQQHIAEAIENGESPMQYMHFSTCDYCRERIIGRKN